MISREPKKHKQGHRTHTVHNRKTAIQPGKAAWGQGGINGNDSRGKAEKGFERESRPGGVRAPRRTSHPIEKYARPLNASPKKTAPTL